MNVQEDESDASSEEEALQEAPPPSPRRPAVVDEICRVIKKHEVHHEMTVSRARLESRECFVLSDSLGSPIQ